MTEEEIKAIEAAYEWIHWEALHGDSPATQWEAKKITDALDAIIKRHRNQND